MRRAAPLLCAAAARAAVVDIESQGAVAGEAYDLATAVANAGVFNTTLAGLRPGDTLLVPNKTFWLMGGILSTGLTDAVVQIDGTLRYSDDEKAWPRRGKKVMECMQFEQARNVTFTSSGRGLIDGNGGKWWGVIKYATIGENRPRLLHVHNSEQLLVENLILKDSPYWTTTFDDVADLEIRYVDISIADKTPGTHDMTAFNTDGLDVSGKNVWIHDCNIWNSDDCIAVKEQNGNSLKSSCSENMLFERINASGVGLTIGSIGPSKAHTCVKNITFRDCTMHNTFKGIYMKSRNGHPGDTGEITDVLYENIEIHDPTQWAIWIGPAQQADSSNVCSLTWPTAGKCPVGPYITWTNITLRNVTVYDPAESPGVILGNETNPMQVTFDGVKVINGNKKPWGDKYYACEGTVGHATGGTDPAPPCFDAAGR